MVGKLVFHWVFSCAAWYSTGIAIAPPAMLATQLRTRDVFEIEVGQGCYKHRTASDNNMDIEETRKTQDSRK